MKPILFYSKLLRFFFPEYSSRLRIYDFDHLPYSHKFLLSVYNYAEKSAMKLPERYCLNETNVLLILNIKNSIFTFHVSKILALRGKEFNCYVTYSKETLNRIGRVIKEEALYTDGIYRAAPAKGVIFFCNTEDEKELFEIGTGLLNMYSPEEIEKNFM